LSIFQPGARSGIIFPKPPTGHLFYSCGSTLKISHLIRPLQRQFNIVAIRTGDEGVNSSVS